MECGKKTRDLKLAIWSTYSKFAVLSFFSIQSENDVLYIITEHEVILNVYAYYTSLCMIQYTITDKSYKYFSRNHDTIKKIIYIFVSKHSFKGTNFSPVKWLKQF